MVNTDTVRATSFRAACGRVLQLVHTVVIYLWTVSATAICAPAAILLGLIDRSGRCSHRVARVWGRSILFVSRVKVATEGLSHIDPGRSYIYMSNHQSNFDIPVMLACLKVEFRWLAKKELFNIPIFGHGMRGAGYISIDRSDRRAAIESLREAARIIRSGVSVLIFPEGTRSMDGRILPFKKGGFILAIDAEVPLVPIVVRGTRAIMPKKRLLIKPGRVFLEVKPPVDAGAYTRADKEALMDTIRTTICDGFERGGGGTAQC